MESFSIGAEHDPVPARAPYIVRCSPPTQALHAEQGSLASHSKTELHSSPSELFISAHREARDEKGNILVPSSSSVTF